MTSLATFVDRYTMKHVRIYPHPLDRVWAALTEDEHMNKWFGFPVKTDLRVGGVCDWGPGGAFYRTKISVLEPMTLLQHDHYPENNGYMRYELSEHPDGCKFEFIHHFDPKDSFEESPQQQAGADLPGGVDTPWRPNFVGGFHGIWNNLGNYLDGLPLDHGDEPTNEFALEVIESWLWRKTEASRAFTPEQAEQFRTELRNVVRWNEMNVLYRDHIKNTIPPR
jgi:uncharacterized protein YndB with AHSA1/START domain